MISRTKYLCYAYGIVVIVLIILGCTFRTTYTDIQKKDSFMAEFEVGAVPENMVEDWCNFILDEAHNPENIILRVKTVDNEFFDFLAEKQKVEIEYIFQKGNSSVSVGDICYICRGANCLMYSGKKNGSNYANLGFVNSMKVGEEYLVIMQAEVSKLDEHEITTLLTDTSFFPIFAYKDSESYQINPFTEPGSIWVPYKGMENNEFFAESDEVYQKLMNMKHDLVSEFPADEGD